MSISPSTEKALAKALAERHARDVDEAVQALVKRFGAKAVKSSIGRVAKLKRGRKPEADWPDIHYYIERDARQWLAGGDPFTTRSVYSIAKEFADKKPGHSHPATMKRIERKLAPQRIWRTLVIAENLSRDEYPYQIHLKANEALAEHYGLWRPLCESVRDTIAQYERKFGEPAPAEMTFKQVEDATRNAFQLPGALAPSNSGGLLGLLNNDPGEGR